MWLFKKIPKLCRHKNKHDATPVLTYENLSCWYTARLIATRICPDCQAELREIPMGIEGAFLFMFANGSLNTWKAEMEKGDMRNAEKYHDMYMLFGLALKKQNSLMPQIKMTHFEKYPYP